MEEISLYDNSNNNRYLYNGKEVQTDLKDQYDYGARFYDPVIGRWTGVDMSIENNHQAWTAYAYVYDNPISLGDPDGRDSIQRAQAIARAREFIRKNDNGYGNTYQMGGKGNPGEPCDCSNLVSKSIQAGGEKDPNMGNSNGVTNIAENTSLVNPRDVVPGNIVILDGSNHIGIVTLVQRDKDGNIVNEQMIDSGGKPSSGKSGPRVSNLITNGKIGYWGGKVDSYRKWDTKPDVSSTDNNNSDKNQQGTDLWDSIKNSITNTFNTILDSF